MSKTNVHVLIRLSTFECFIRCSQEKNQDLQFAYMASFLSPLLLRLCKSIKIKASKIPSLYLVTMVYIR